jgi:hypothetical protein
MQLAAEPSLQRCPSEPHLSDRHSPALPEALLGSRLRSACMPQFTPPLLVNRRVTIKLLVVLLALSLHSHFTLVFFSSCVQIFHAIPPTSCSLRLTLTAT